MPFFSIIIPTFNSEKTLKDCLNSIVSQTFEDYEILLIDGVSTDSTLDIVKEFSLKYPNIHWVSETDHGIYDAMNKGIKLAKGEWIYFLGSDDTLYERTTLNSVSKITNRTKRKIIYGNVLVSGNAGWALDGQIYDGEFSKNKIICRNICHQSIFYHKDIFERLSYFNTKYKICADHEFNIRACAVFKYEYCDLIIAKFCGGGISSNPDYFFINDYEEIIIKNHLKIVHRLIEDQKLYRYAVLNYRSKRMLISGYLFFLFAFKKLLKKI